MSEPNVLVYVMDSARYDDFADIYARFEHPLMNDFAVFPNAYSFGTWTKPASSSILFGLPARVTGMKAYDDAIPADVAGVYAPLRESGYKVSLVTTNVIVSSAFGYDRFYDLLCDVFDDERGVDLRSNVPDEAFSAIQRYAAGRSLGIVPSDVLHAEFLSRVEGQHDRYVSFIWSMDTHDPYYDLSGDKEPKVIVTNRDIREANPSVLRKAHELHHRSVEYNLRSFFTLLESIDRERYQNMLICLISDHGDSFGEKTYVASLRRCTRKQIVSHDTFPVQEVIRIPFCIKFPQRRIRQHDLRKVVTTNSLLATVFDLIGIEPQIPLFGTSLLDQSDCFPWQVVCEHEWAGSPYVALVDCGNGYQFIGRIDQPQGAESLLQLAKRRIRDWVQSSYGVTGFREISDQSSPRLTASGLRIAIEDYLQRCGSYNFVHSKIQAHVDAQEQVFQRLRSLGYMD